MNLRTFTLSLASTRPIQGTSAQLRGYGTAAPFEYKYAEFKDAIFQTYKFQLVLHAIMIKENCKMDVKKGFICFTRSNNHIEEVDFTEKDFKKGIDH